MLLEPECPWHGRVMRYYAFEDVWACPGWRCGEVVRGEEVPWPAVVLPPVVVLRLPGPPDDRFGTDIPADARAAAAEDG